MDNLFLIMVKILGFAFAGGFVNVFEMGLRLVDSEVETREDVMSIGLDFLSVLSVLVLVVSGTPGVEVAIFAVLNLDDNRL